MTSGVPFAGGGNEGTAIGIDPGAARVTTSLDGRAQGRRRRQCVRRAVPFAADPRVLPIFRPHMPGLDVCRVLAPISGRCPTRARLGSYRITLAQPQVASVSCRCSRTRAWACATTDPVGAQSGAVRGGRLAGCARVLTTRSTTAPGTQRSTRPASRAVPRRLADHLPPGAARRGPRALRFGLRGGRRSTRLPRRPRLALHGRVVHARQRRAEPPRRSSPRQLAHLHGRCGRQGAALHGLGRGAGLDLPDDVQALARGRLGARGARRDGDLGQAAWFGTASCARDRAGGRGRDPGERRLARGSARRRGSRTSTTSTSSGSTPPRRTRHDRAVGSRPSAARAAFTSACGASLRSTGMPAPGGQIDYRSRAAPGSQALLTLGLSTQLGAVRCRSDLGLFAPASPDWRGTATYRSVPAVPVPAGRDRRRAAQRAEQPGPRGSRGLCAALVYGAGGPSATNAHLISIR
jgi:hypothetical protein